MQFIRTYQYIVVGYQIYYKDYRFEISALQI